MSTKMVQSIMKEYTTRYKLSESQGKKIKRISENTRSPGKNQYKFPIKGKCKSPEKTQTKSYKVCEVNGIEKVVSAASFKELIQKGKEKLFLDGKLIVVLESDGTVVGDEEYFATLSPNTGLMFLHPGEKWAPRNTDVDQTDDCAFRKEIKCQDCGATVKSYESKKEEQKLPPSGHKHLKELIDRLQKNVAEMALLGEEDLNELADMNIEDFSNIYKNVYSEKSLNFIKEAAGRLLVDYREAKEAMELLKLYSSLDRSQTKTPRKSTATQNKTARKRKVSKSKDKIIEDEIRVKQGRTRSKQISI